MKEQIEMPKGIFYLIVGTCVAIILFTSIEVLFRAKDTQLFEMWLSNPKLNTALAGQTNEQLFSTYLSMCLSIFFVRIITPMGIAIHSYFALTKLRVNKLFVIIWTMLLIGSFAISILSESLFTIFFILSGIGHVILIFTLIYLWKCIKDVMTL